MSNYTLVNIKLSKTQLSKIAQLGGFLGRLLGPLPKTGLPLMKNAIKSLTKSVLIPLLLTAAASAADAVTHKKILGSRTTTLIISNDGMEDMKIVRSLEDSGLLLKGVSEAIQNQTKEQNEGFLSMLLDTSGVSLLGDMLTGKGFIRAGYSSEGKGTLRAGYGPKETSKIPLIKDF